MCSLTNEGITAFTSLSPVRLCPVWGTGWTTSRVACGSIPEPSEGRHLSCSDTGSHAPIEYRVMHKAIHTLQILQKFWNHHCSYPRYFIVVNVFFYLIYNMCVIVPEAVILYLYYMLILARYVTMDVVISNPTRDAQAAVIRAFRFIIVVQLMGLAHYARLISASFRDVGMSTCLLQHRLVKDS